MSEGDRTSRKRKKVRQDDEDEAPSRRRKTSSVASMDDTEMELAEMSQLHADPELRERRPAECGIIEKISLKNFMCHSNLDVSFGPNATILNGKNGSGKSAILVAIVVGLGGAAASTKRGQSLKNFIKEGCSSAMIVIRIKNRGDNAFQPEMYGDSIIIERRIAMDSSGSYKIKSAHEKVMATTKDDLTRVLDHFNIQVDNPVCVLQQDMSRSFMHSTSAKDKYKFFMQATQLDLMCRNYTDIIKYKEELAEQMKVKKESLPNLERDVTRKEQRFKDLERLDKLEHRKAALECDIAWAQVKDLEAILEATRGDAKEKEKRLPQYEKKLRDCETAIRRANEALDEIRAGLDDIRKEAQAVTAANTQKSAELRKRKQELRAAQSNVQEVKGRIKGTEADRQVVLRHIKAIQQEATRDREAESKEREARLQQLRQELREVQDRLRTSIDFRQQLERALHSYQEQKYTSKSDLSVAEQQADEQHRRLEQLKSSVQNRVQVFGRGYAELVRKIEAADRQRKFRRRPVGPLGMHVKLRDEKWALAVEACITRGLLSGFVVDNGDDKRVMQQLIRECRMDRQPTLIMSQFLDRPHDVARNRAQTNHPTVMDVLDIDSPIVFNALIDQRSIESHVLVFDPREARDFIWSRPSPARCTSVYTGAGDVAYPDRNYQSNRVKDVFCLQRNVEAEIAHVEQEVQRYRATVQELNGERLRLDGQINDTNRELKSCRTKMGRDQDKANRLQADVAELANFEEDAPQNVAALEEDIRSFDLKLDELRTELQEAEELVSEMVPVLKQQEEEQNVVSHQKEDLFSRSDSLKADFTKADRDLAAAKQHKEHYQNGLHSKQAEFTKLQEQILHHEENLQKTEEMVKQAFPVRSTSKRGVKHLESELKQMDKALREKEKSCGSREEITQEYHDVSARFKRLTSDIDMLDKLGNKLGKAVDHRNKKFKCIRTRLEARLKVHFYLFMTKRGYQGRFEFDNDEETLDMHVKVVDDAKLTKDTKTLSGGERSFSMVAFILSLWDVMETPFRCLDEFDVFMDLVNRRIAMEMLLNAANTNRRRQFILLTPQDLSDWSNKDHVRILRMKDPIRDQPTLDAHLVPR